MMRKLKITDGWTEYDDVASCRDMTKIEVAVRNECGVLRGCFQGFVRATPMIPGKVGGWEDNCGAHDIHHIKNELCSLTTREPEDVPQSIKVHSSVVR